VASGFAIQTLRDRVTHLTAEYQKVQGEATMDTLRRFRAMVVVTAPLHLGLALWFALYVAPQGRPDLQAWADSLVPLQAGHAVFLLVFGVLTHRYLNATTRASTAGVVLQCVLCAAYLLFGAVASIQDVEVGNGIATFLIISQGVAVLSLMRPLLALGVFATAFVVFASILRTTGVDATLLSSILIQAVSVVLISLVISLVMWHQYTRTVLLRRQLSQSNEALLEKQKELEVLAQRDALTGLYNRRQFTSLAEMELAREPCQSGGIGLLMVDLDFFKRINDQYGHPGGDEVLRQVATLLTEGVRTTDLLGRLGGEEFIVLLPQTSLAKALEIAEKLRAALAEKPLKVANIELPVTASFGATWLSENQPGMLQALYSAADQALYYAKHGGRNRVEVAMPTPKV